MVSLINKQLLLTAYAYLFIMEQQKAQQGSEALQLRMEIAQKQKALPEDSYFKQMKLGAEPVQQLDTEVMNGKYRIEPRSKTEFKAVYTMIQQPAPPRQEVHKRFVLGSDGRLVIDPSHWNSLAQNEGEEKAIKDFTDNMKAVKHGYFEVDQKPVKFVRYYDDTDKSNMDLTQKNKNGRPRPLFDAKENLLHHGKDERTVEDSLGQEFRPNFSWLTKTEGHNPTQGDGILFVVDMSGAIFITPKVRATADQEKQWTKPGIQHSSFLRGGQAKFAGQFFAERVLRENGSFRLAGRGEGTDADLRWVLAPFSGHYSTKPKHIPNGLQALVETWGTGALKRFFVVTGDTSSQGGKWNDFSDTRTWTNYKIQEQWGVQGLRHKNFLIVEKAEETWARIAKKSGNAK